MGRILAIATLLLAAGLLLSLLVACASGKQFAKAEIQDPGQLLFNGLVRAEVDCYRCHNGDGRGANGPDLSPVMAKMDDQAVLKIIEEGAMFMPAYKDRTTTEERGQLLAWLRASFGGPKAEKVLDGDAIAE